MKYIIMAGGNYKEFETPKQLLKVKGERLIDRTIRLLKENNVDDIAISSNNPLFDDCGVPRLTHENNYVTNSGVKVSGYWVEAFYPTDEPVTYLYGDVYYSNYAIRTIVNTNTDDVLFFASKNVHGRPEYIKNWEEPFAFKVVNQKKFREKIEFCKQEYDKGHCNREPISWELYRVLNGYDINTHIIGDNFVAIDDYSTDIDCLSDIEKLEKVL